MKLAKYVKFRQEKFGGVLFETRAEKVYSINPTAAAVVAAIESGLSEGEIPAHLKQQFKTADEGAIEREAVEFLACLREKGLIDG